MVVILWLAAERMALTSGACRQRHAANGRCE
jgi:hypothetical protein